MTISNHFDIVKIAAFFKRNLPCLRSWKREQLITWLAWNSGRGNVVVVEDHGRIVGAAVARPVENYPDSRIAYRFNEKGGYLYIEQLAAKNKQAFKALIAYLRARFPLQTDLFFSRSSRGGKMKFYNIEKFLKKAL